MFQMTWARDALGLRLIAVGASIATDTAVTRATTMLGRPVASSESATDRTVPSSSAMLLAERTAASGVSPLRAW